MKKIICLYGGPCSGKSTLQAQLFVDFKVRGLNAEMNREYIKNWIYEGRKVNFGDQLYITSKMLKTERHLISSGVDIIINDSPILLNMVYANLYNNTPTEQALLENIVKYHHDYIRKNQYTIEHFICTREGILYQCEGRYQSADEAARIDHLIVEQLDRHNINYYTLNTGTVQQRSDEIMLYLSKKMFPSIYGVGGGIFAQSNEPVEEQHMLYRGSYSVLDGFR